MKKLVVIVILIGIGVAGWFGIKKTGLLGPGKSPGKSARKAPTTAEVKRRSISVDVTAVGEINPANSVMVKPEVSGRIQTMDVLTGAKVSKGDLLVALDDTDLLTEKQTAETDIRGAGLQLNKARRDLERKTELHQSALIPREELDDAKTAFEQAEVDYQRTEKKLQTVEDKLKKIRILAPFDGTILSINVTKGQVVSGATSVSQGTDLMTLADLNEMVIRAHINQMDVTKIQPGQSVEITVDSIPNTKLAGKVILIAPVATVKNNIKGFSVDVLITQTDPRVRPGMNANVRFPVARAENTLTVPIAAVFTEDGSKIVFVKTAAGTERREVRVGVTDFRHAEILEGLKEGETISLERPAAPAAAKS